MNPLANRMASNKAIARWPIALATVLGVGALIVWAFVCFWINFVVENAVVTYRQDDNLIFTAEGQAYFNRTTECPTARWRFTERWKGKSWILKARISKSTPRQTRNCLNPAGDAPRQSIGASARLDSAKRVRLPSIGT